MFGKKQQAQMQVESPKVPSLVNIPEKIVTGNVESTKEKESVEFYVIWSRQRRSVDGKEFYLLGGLVKLEDFHLIDGLYCRPKGKTEASYFLRVSLFTNGKETLRIGRTGYSVGEGELGPLFSISLDSGLYTFYPRFYQVIADAEMILLRIQAPQAWHQEMHKERMQIRIDPEISVAWEPKYE